MINLLGCVSANIINSFKYFKSNRLSFKSFNIFLKCTSITRDTAIPEQIRQAKRTARTDDQNMVSLWLVCKEIKRNSQYAKLSVVCKLSKAALNTAGTPLIYQTTYL